MSAPIASQLSLFDEAPGRTASPPGVQRPSAPGSAAVSGAPSVAAASLAPAEFRHPQANREIRLQQHLVAYALKRARRRSIGFVVGVEGLCVAAPRWVGVADIESALHEKAGWILRKLDEQRERARRQTAARVEWRDGAAFPFLGESVGVVLDAQAPGGAVLHTAAAASPGTPRLALHVGLPHGAQPGQIRDAVQSWLQRQARRIFEERVQLLAPRLGVRCTQLRLSSAQTRWGSASADGRIRLNWRLVHFAMPTIDYVVAHELAHLREMNHSPRFWDVVRSVLPDYERARGSLKDDLLPVFD